MKVGSSVVVVTGGEQDLEQSVRGSSLTTCRALIMYFNDQGNTTTDLVFRYNNFYKWGQLNIYCRSF